MENTQNDILIEIPTTLRRGLHQQSYNFPFPIFITMTNLLQLSMCSSASLVVLHEGLTKEYQEKIDLKKI